MVVTAFNLIKTLSCETFCFEPLTFLLFNLLALNFLFIPLFFFNIYSILIIGQLLLCLHSPFLQKDQNPTSDPRSLFSVFSFVNQDT